MTEQHWGNFLVQGFPMDKEVEVTFPVEARSTRASMVLVASRIAGLMAALGPLDEHDPNADPLAAEDVTEVTRLLDHLHRVRVALEGEEERLLLLLAERGVSLRTLATALEVNSPSTVKNRLDRIREANEQGLTAAGADEAP